MDRELEELWYDFEMLMEECAKQLTKYKQDDELKELLEMQTAMKDLRALGPQHVGKEKVRVLRDGLKIRMHDNQEQQEFVRHMNGLPRHIDV